MCFQCSAINLTNCSFNATQLQLILDSRIEAGSRLGYIYVLQHIQLPLPEGSLSLMPTALLCSRQTALSTLICLILPIKFTPIVSSSHANTVLQMCEDHSKHTTTMSATHFSIKLSLKWQRWYFPKRLYAFPICTYLALSVKVRMDLACCLGWLQPLYSSAGGGGLVINCHLHFCTSE